MNSVADPPKAFAEINPASYIGGVGDALTDFLPRQGEELHRMVGVYLGDVALPSLLAKDTDVQIRALPWDNQVRLGHNPDRLVGLRQTWQSRADLHLRLGTYLDEAQGQTLSRPERIELLGGAAMAFSDLIKVMAATRLWQRDQADKATKTLVGDLIVPKPNDRKNWQDWNRLAAANNQRKIEFVDDLLAVQPA